MRILYINGKNNNGGANIALLNIVKGMMAKGHEIHVLTDKRQGFFLDEINKLGCHVYTCNCALNVKIASWVKNPITFLNYYIYHFYTWYNQKRFIKKIIKEIKPDIVHTNIGPLTTAAVVCENLGVPHVWHIREYGKEVGFRIFPSQKYFDNKIKQDNTYCIAITKGLFNYNNMRKHHDCYIYDGVFPHSQIDLSIQGDKKDYILFVGRIEKAKGVKDLLEAYALFHQKKPQYRLLLAGGYNENDLYYQDCIEFIKDNKLSQCVDFLGIRHDVYDLMSHARFQVVASPMEGFGFITAEAMLNYCLVIGKDCYGTKEQFDNGIQWTGGEIAYRYKTQQELVDNMVKAVSDDNGDIIQRAHSVLSNYTIEKNVMQIEHFYKKILIF